MNARAQILKDIQAVKQGSTTLDDVVAGVVKYSNPKAKFIEMLTLSGGKVVESIDTKELFEYLLDEKLNGKKVVNGVLNESIGTGTKDELYNTDIACIKGGIAVAENGAIWVTEKNMKNRMLPFSCEQLVIVIEEKNIVSNMEEAYKLIDIAEDGYGVFIAGPSKTADIEQSLVIGAHGPISFKVFILK